VSKFPFAKLNPNKILLDIQVKPLYDADHDVVAPHGLFGQSYDGDNVGVDGKHDSRGGVETTTSAQAEGAIEGKWSEYKMSSPFAVDFKYSRFSATSAKPRDPKRLSGYHHTDKAPTAGTAYPSVGASALDDSASTLLNVTKG
jgi:hypothetical protein